MTRAFVVTLATLGIAALFAVGAAVAATRRQGASSDSTRATSNRTDGDTATTALPPRVLATGSVRLSAGARIEVGAQISGRVRTLAVTQGSHVHSGDVIAQLDTQEARALVDQASAQVRELIASERQALDQEQRVEALAAARGATPQDLMAAQTAASQAHARLDAAKAAEDLARTRFGYTTIRAPISGIVASVSTHEGETVAASFTTPTFVTIIDPTRLEVVALIDETDIGRVSLGDAAEFTVDAYPGRRYHGVVARIAPDATIVGGVVDYEVVLRLIGSTNGLKPQMTTAVTITRTRVGERQRGIS